MVYTSSPYRLEPPERIVDFLLNHADIQQRFPARRVAEDPLQAHNIVRRLIIPIPKRFAQRMAADALLYARLARNHVHDLVGALARDGLVPSSKS